MLSLVEGRNTQMVCLTLTYFLLGLRLTSLTMSAGASVFDYYTYSSFYDDTNPRPVLTTFSFLLINGLRTKRRQCIASDFEVRMKVKNRE